MKKKLDDYFMTLNTFSSISFTTSTNVDFTDNKSFVIPSDKRWFKLQFLSNSPDDIGIGNNEQERMTGIYQIDIYTPLDKGTVESGNKYKWIKKLFKKGTEIDELTINKVYKATSSTEENNYKTVIRVEWTADITND